MWGQVLVGPGDRSVIVIWRAGDEQAHGPRGALRRHRARPAPGDVVFFITHRPGGGPSSVALPPLARVPRRGHLPVAYRHLRGPSRSAAGGRCAPHIIHARTGGVVEEHLRRRSSLRCAATSARWSRRAGGGPALSYPHRRAAPRRAAYSRAQLGRGSRRSAGGTISPPTRWGCRAGRSRRGRSRATLASPLRQVGIAFPHALRQAPVTNLAHYLGIPSGTGAAGAPRAAVPARPSPLPRRPLRLPPGGLRGPADRRADGAEDPGKYTWTRTCGRPTRGSTAWTARRRRVSMTTPATVRVVSALRVSPRGPGVSPLGSPWRAA